jgi:hypothetical protein
MTPTTEKLRVALVWNGEMMADHLAATPGAVTLGTTTGATFVVPALPVPDGFAVIRAEGDGWAVALAGGLGGTVHGGGELRELRADAAAVTLVPIRSGDWGVISLDAATGLELFFQFVAGEPPLPRSRSRLDLLTPALAFALLLHGIMLLVSYSFDEGVNPFAYPGDPHLTGQFLVQRVKAPAEPERAAPGAAAATVPSPGAGQGDGGGRQGGEPEVGVPTADRSAPPPATRPPEKGLFTPRARSIIAGVITHDVTPTLGKFMGLPGPGRRPGPPGVGDAPAGGTRPGPGFVPGDGRDGPGHPGPLNVGPIRDRKPTGGGDEPRETHLDLLPPTTRAPTLTHKEINDVVKSRAGLIRACYQRGADKRQGLAGTLTVSFTIGADGKVSQSKIARDRSTFTDGGVEGCVLRQIDRLVFPARGGGHVVYPFRFSQD